MTGGIRQIRGLLSSNWSTLILIDRLLILSVNFAKPHASYMFLALRTVIKFLFGHQFSIIANGHRSSYIYFSISTIRKFFSTLGFSFHKDTKVARITGNLTELFKFKEILLTNSPPRLYLQANCKPDSNWRTSIMSFCWQGNLHNLDVY